MSIRYECVGCGSVMKIKESLAGTSGKCPTCKKKFVVPQKSADSGVALESAADSAQPAPETVKAVVPESSAAPIEKSASAPAAAAKGNEFDLDAFLMDDSVPNAKASAGLSAPAAPTAPPPKFDKQGRRTFAAPPPSPGSSAEIPTAATPSASANAHDLMTKSKDDGRAKPGAVPRAPRKPLINFDIAGSVKQLRQYAVYLVLGVVAVGGLYWLADRMMSERLPLPKLGAVSGTVTLNGQPLPNVVVHITPINPLEGKTIKGKGIRLRDASGVTNDQGYYEVQYIAGVPGAALGNARVWLEPTNPADFKKIPASYLSSGSTDIRDVKAVGNESKFNIELKTAK